MESEKAKPRRYHAATATCSRNHPPRRRSTVNDRSRRGGCAPACGACRHRRPLLLRRLPAAAEGPPGAGGCARAGRRLSGRATWASKCPHRLLRGTATWLRRARVPWAVRSGGKRASRNCHASMPLSSVSDQAKCSGGFHTCVHGVAALLWNLTVPVVGQAGRGPEKASDCASRPHLPPPSGASEAMEMAGADGRPGLPDRDGSGALSLSASSLAAEYTDSEGVFEMSVGGHKCLGKVLPFEVRHRP